MADEEPRTGELVTANYGWIKPTVGDSDDAWGGYLNSDLDGIDSVVHGIQTSIPTVPSPSGSAPAMDGTATAGSSAAWSRGDHVHPSDTTKYNTSNPSGYQTAANVTASLAPYALTTSLASYLALSGGTMTGAMTLAADPAANLQPATKQYVDAVRVGDNRIINGDMRIDQRNNGASGANGAGVGYWLDRWATSGSVASKYTVGRNLGSLATPPGFPYYFGFTSSSAYALLAADYFYCSQPIEADMVSDFAWGTANAQPVILSFWAFSSLTGTFGGCITNYASTRSYPFSYSIPVANTPTKIAVTIPGDTAGTWVMNGNAGAARLYFSLGAGTTYSGPAGAWASASYFSATGAVSVVGTNGATFYVTGVKLEIGSVATPFNRQSLAKSMADCQRYYQQIGGGAVSVTLQGYAPAANSTLACTINYSTMRANPTAARIGAWTIGNASAPNLYVGLNSLGLNTLSAAAGQVNVYATDATGLITLSAEL